MILQIAARSALDCSPRAAAVLREQQQRLFAWTDHLFAALLLFEWIFGILISLIVSPRAWAGVISHVHIHVWYAIFLGGAICLVPAALGWRMAGQASTRHIIALAQSLMSALLIHLTGGRIETHFILFGSLAFLAFYRDWRVLVTATTVIAVDHVVRGIYWPMSIYGVASGAEWRWLEHVGWVLFEDFFLVIACLQGVRDMRLAAIRQAELEQMYESAVSVTEARKAGMAEIATGILHNVGNVLNSVNVSASQLQKQVTSSKVGSLSKAATMLLDHQDDLGAFLERDEKGKRLPEYLFKLSDTLIVEQEHMQAELHHLAKSVDHIKEIVSVHQQYAGTSNVSQWVIVNELISDALKMSAAAMARSDIDIDMQCASCAPVLIDKHKVLQILVNLLSNAKHALDDQTASPKKVTVHCEQSEDNIRISVSDNGAGIAPENLPKMFTYGFTTRSDGHGFGLHSCALAAQEINGSIAAASDGVGRGATFTLDIPYGGKG